MIEWIFQPRCAGCGGLPAPMCAGCAGSLVELGAACRRCAQPLSEDAVCRRCLRTPLPVDRIVAPWRFGGELASAIRRLKFTGATHVARTLAPLWAPVLAAAVDELDAIERARRGAAWLGRAKATIVVPIPLHWRRRFTRGYDHAWLLAIHACRDAGIAPPVCALRRIRHAPPQSTLPASERRDNLRGAFALRRRFAAQVADRAVILVDDVVTTGSTLAAAARPLLDAGARSVTGVAIARAE